MKARNQASHGFLQKELCKYRRLFKLCFATRPERGFRGLNAVFTKPISYQYLFVFQCFPVFYKKIREIKRNIDQENELNSVYILTHNRIFWGIWVKLLNELCKTHEFLKSDSYPPEKKIYASMIALQKWWKMLFISS